MQTAYSYTLFLCPFGVQNFIYVTTNIVTKNHRTVVQVHERSVGPAASLVLVLLVLVVLPLLPLLLLILCTGRGHSCGHSRVDRHSIYAFTGVVQRRARTASHLACCVLLFQCVAAAAARPPYHA